jgi:hypothetical protein
MQNFIAKSPEWIKNTWASRNSEGKLNKMVDLAKP